MIKKLIYILIFLPLFTTGQINFFNSHVADRFLFVDASYPQYVDGYFSYDIFFCDYPHNWAGTRMYILGGEDRAVVFQYTISDWNISSAVYSAYKDLTPEDNQPTGIFIRNDGKKMYMIGTNTDYVYQYSLSSDWAINTASYETGKKFYIGSDESAPTSIYFKPDGTKFYVLGQENDKLLSYSLFSAWDVSTANIDGYAEIYVGDKEPNPTSLAFSSDGLHVYIGGTYNEKILTYELSTAWTLPDPWNGVTATFCAEYTTRAGEPASGLFVKYNGTKIYTTGFGSVIAYYFNEPVYRFDNPDGL